MDFFGISLSPQIISTAALTILGSVFIYSAGKAVEKFLIEPHYELSMAKAKVAYDLYSYAYVYCNPGTIKEKENEVSETLRSDAANLFMRINSLPIYNKIVYKIIEPIGLAPKEQDIQGAIKKLTGLSNSVTSGDPLKNKELREDIQKLLKIKSLD